MIGTRRSKSTFRVNSRETNTFDKMPTNDSTTATVGVLPEEKNNDNNHKQESSLDTNEDNENHRSKPKIKHVPVKREKKTSAECCTICGKDDQEVQFSEERRMTEDQIESYKTFVHNCKSTLEVNGLICDRCYSTCQLQLESKKVKPPYLRFRNEISPNLSAHKLVKQYSNFKHVDRIDYSNITDEIIDEYMFVKKEPLVITNTMQALLKNSESRSEQVNLFKWDYLLSDEVKDITLYPRNNDTLTDMEEMSLHDYAKYLLQEKTTRRYPNLYGKDIQCPKQWKSFLFDNKIFNPRFKYKGEMDLLAALPEQTRAISLMVYIGDGGTFTPAHQDLCGTLGHNLMVYADNGELIRSERRCRKTSARRAKEQAIRIYQNDTEMPEDEAYALWCVFHPSQMKNLKEFWEKHGGYIEHDNIFIPLKYLAGSNISTTLIEQKVGDLVLLPPQAPHQVVNENGKSAKIAWNTLSYKSIEDSYACLESYRANGKTQIYRIKAVSYFALKSRTEDIEHGLNQNERGLEELLSLLKVVTQIYFEDWIDSALFDSSKNQIKRIEDRDSNGLIRNHERICNYCSCDIWNRWFHCDICKNMKNEFEGDDYCLDCYADLRGCSHRESMIMCEHIPMKEIRTTIDCAKQAYVKLRQQLHNDENFTEKELNILLDNTKFQSTRSTASVAFELHYKENQEEKEKLPCHQCKQKYHAIETIKCDNGCGLYYCGSCLWSRYLVKYSDILKAKSAFVCPKCLEICNCNPCLIDRNINPSEYESLMTKKAATIKEIEPFIERSLTDMKPDHKIGVADTCPTLIKGNSYPIPKRKVFALKNNKNSNEPNPKVAKLDSSLGKGESTHEIGLENLASKVISQVTNPIGNQANALERRFHPSIPFACSECKYTALKGSIMQSVEDRNMFYCKKCFSRLNTKDKQFIEYNFKCDNCRETIIGTRYSRGEHDFCEKCMIRYLPSELAEEGPVNLKIYPPKIPNVQFSLGTDDKQ